MAPHEIRDAVLKQLREARSRMLELDYLLALEERPLEERKKAALQLSRIQLQYLRLRRARLADIRAGLVELEPELRQGIDGLSKALTRLDRVETIADATEAILGLLGKVLPRP